MLPGDLRLVKRQFTVLRTKGFYPPLSSFRGKGSGFYVSDPKFWKDLLWVEKAGNLRAFVSIRLGGVTIHECRIIQQPGQHAWVSMPQREYAGQNGKRRFAAVVELSDALKEKVSAAVLETWEKRK